ncbi:MAG: GNA1162 family protein [Syntrophales bacterium]
MVKAVRPLLFVLVVVLLAGCAAKIPHVIVSDYGKRGMRLIAVMPVINNSSDPKSAEMLRTKLVDELYFKGYPRIPVKVIDEKLAAVSSGSGEKVSPQVIGEMLKVDAVLYPVLNESGMGHGIFYAATAVEAQFELFSAKTGESLWRVRYGVVDRNWGFSRKQVELKSSQVYEPALQKVVNRALETLPDGSDAAGS